MEEYGYLLFIAIVLISTKCLGLVTKRFHMPQVVGALGAKIHQTDFEKDEYRSR